VALGASTGSVTFLVLRQSMRLAGFRDRAGQRAGARCVPPFCGDLVGINVFDGLAYGGGVLLVIAASAAAAYFPRAAQRASIDNHAALRLNRPEESTRAALRPTVSGALISPSSTWSARANSAFPALGISALNGQALHWDRPPALHRASMEYFLLFVA